MFFIAPIQKVGDVPAWGKALGAVGGAMSVLFSRVGFVVLVLLLVLSIWDWYLGSAIAVAKQDHDPARAQFGKLEKMTSLFLVIVMLAVDFWLEQHGYPHTRGWIGTTAGLWWCIDEFLSILRHKKVMGGRVPGWLEGLAKMGHAEVDARMELLARRLAVRTLSPQEIREVQATLDRMIAERQLEAGEESQQKEV